MKKLLLSITLLTPLFLQAQGTAPMTATTATTAAAAAEKDTGQTDRIWEMDCTQQAAYQLKLYNDFQSLIAEKIPQAGSVIAASYHQIHGLEAQRQITSDSLSDTARAAQLLVKSLPPALREEVRRLYAVNYHRQYAKCADDIAIFHKNPHTYAHWLVKEVQCPTHGMEWLNDATVRKELKTYLPLVPREMIELIAQYAPRPGYTVGNLDGFMPAGQLARGDEHGRYCAARDNRYPNADYVQVLDLSRLGLCDMSGLNKVADLSKVVELDLSDNCLEEIPMDVMRQCTQLDCLYLDGNQITKFPNEFYAFIELHPTLRRITLTGNPLSAETEKKLMKCWDWLPNLKLSQKDIRWIVANDKNYKQVTAATGEKAVGALSEHFAKKQNDYRTTFMQERAKRNEKFKQEKILERNKIKTAPNAAWNRPIQEWYSLEKPKSRCTIQ